MMRTLSRVVVAIILCVLVVYSIVSTHTYTHTYTHARIQQTIDTTAINQWCGDGSSIRMVGAWPIDYTDTASVVVEDEQGNYWTLEGYDIEEQAFLLLWISDSEEVVKVWQEMYIK